MPEERVILHSDCNNFFASVELLDYPELQDKPVAVAGDPEGRHGIILAKNMAAKRFHVQTAEPVWQARQKCPGLILLPPHMERYRAFSRRINQMYLDLTDQVEAFSIDESFLDVTGSQQLFGTGRMMADALRERVRRELGITISVGVSDNKTWAKMGSDYKKPDATTVVDRQSVTRTLYPLPVESMLYVGDAAARTLRRHGIDTVGALSRADPQALSTFLGKQGPWLQRAAAGLDDSPVRRWGETDPVKSIGNSVTFSHDLTDTDDYRAGLLLLCDSVGARLRADHLKCRTVTLQIKDPQLKVISRQKTLPTPTSLTRQLYQCACRIFDVSWPAGAPVRLFSVTAGSLSPEDEAFSAQLSFLSDVQTDDPRQAQLEKAVDQVRARFGRAAIRPASLGRED